MTERTARASRTPNLQAVNGAPAPAGTPGLAKTAGKAGRAAAAPVKRDRRATTATAHDRKREQILEVAVNLFFKHGYAGTTIADIADRLGVTKPFVYYYFENKEDLFETLTWDAANACMNTLQFPAGDTRPAIDRLREGLKRLVLANIAHLKAATFFYRETGVLRGPFLRKVRTLGRRFLTELTGLLQAAQQAGDLEFDNARLTALAMGNVVGFMYAWYKPNGAVGAEAMAERLAEAMLRIAGARPPRASRGKGRG